MEHVRALAFDLDGTLCAPDGSITPRTRAALDAVRDRGIHTVLATGRPPRYLGTTPADAGSPELVVCSNGAALYDWLADEVVAAALLEADVVHEMVIAVSEVAPGVGFGIEFATDSALDDVFRAVLNRPTFDEQPLLDDIRAHTGPAPHKVLAAHPELDSAALQRLVDEALGERVYSTHSGLPFVEIAAAGVSKASGVADWCADHDVTAEQVVAFGDMPNDLTMLEWAGWGVAMGNAHPELAAVADHTTGANDADGVADWIERFLL